MCTQEEQHGGPGHGGAGAQRVERLSEELDDMERRVEQVGDVALKLLDLITEASLISLRNP